MKLDEYDPNPDEPVPETCEYESDDCHNPPEKTYLGLDEDDPLYLCEDHYDDYHYGDYLSKR